MSKNPKQELVDAVENITSKAKKDIMSFDNVNNWANDKQMIFRMYLVNFYAHIEGCVKNISLEYIQYLHQIAKYKPYKLITHFHYIVKNQSNAKWVRWMKKLRPKHYRDKDISKTLIDTLNNLNYEILEQILFILNIHENNYIDFKNILDDLVSKRHDIAHGNIKTYNKFIITEAEILKYKELALNLINQFSNDIISSIDSVIIENSNTNKK
ncbi:MAG: hypothetical protein LBK68_03180 [Candidatus Margulisbacteria bacterium]|jgi:hypothetical protein|nr:hypothetical protein [Candidatus Margulisiibacteriota bacterium]